MVLKTLNHSEVYMKIAIIGTAGRDKTKPMTQQLWEWMLADAQSRIKQGSHVVSGGAAWADHLAVALFLSGWAGELTLHLPAPFQHGKFSGPSGSSASAANYYHGLFSRVLNVDTLSQIEQVTTMDNVAGSFEPEMVGYRGMFNRNAKVAVADEMLAYTFGVGGVPADGGTKDTWDKCRGKRTHIPLPY
jgi:hypothetical protein